MYAFSSDKNEQKGGFEILSLALFRVLFLHFTECTYLTAPETHGFLHE